jgi:hypothetical protein
MIIEWFSKHTIKDLIFIGKQSKPSYICIVVSRLLQSVPETLNERSELQ